MGMYVPCGACSLSVGFVELRKARGAVGSCYSPTRGHAVRPPSYRMGRQMRRRINSKRSGSKDRS